MPHELWECLKLKLQKCHVQGWGGQAFLNKIIWEVLLFDKNATSVLNVLECTTYEDLCKSGIRTSYFRWGLWYYLWSPIKYNVPTPFPEWNSLPFPYFFLTWWHSLPILHEIVWNLFTNREYFKILYTKPHFFFNNLVPSVVKYPPFCF